MTQLAAMEHTLKFIKNNMQEFYEDNFPNNPPMQWITFTFNE